MGEADSNTNIRVLVSLTDPRVGGPQRSSLEVADLLTDEGIDTEFLIPAGSGEFAELAEERGYSVHCPVVRRLHPPKQIFSNIEYVFKFPMEVRKILKIIEERDIDIVNARMTINFHAIIAAIISNSSLVWHFNGIGIPKPMARICSTLAQRYADKVVVSAENVVDYYNFDKDEHLTKIYPTVDTDKFCEAGVGHPNISKFINDENLTLLGLVGNINPIKGYKLFIRAFEDVVNERENVIALIAGQKLSTQESYYNNLLNIIEKKNLEDKIQFLDWIENIKHFFSGIDLFVMPSHKETGPMTLMEAMAMEKPIVTTNVGVVPEQLHHGEHAWIVEPGNASQLADTINWALNNRDSWEFIGSNARKCAMEHFSLEIAAKRYLCVYNRTMNHNSY